MPVENSVDTSLTESIVYVQISWRGDTVLPPEVNGD